LTRRLLKRLGFVLRSISSTSWLDCQKNKYGLIVVPRIATTTVKLSVFKGKVGQTNPFNVAIQSIFTTNRTAM